VSGLEAHDALTPDEAKGLEDYLAGRLPPDRRAEIEGRILADERWSEALYSDASLAAALDLASGGAAPRVVPLFPRWARVALPLAAALLLAILSPRIFSDRPAMTEDEPEGPPRFRSGTVTEPPGPRGLAPSGPTSLPARFTWTRWPDATAYRVEMLDTSGRLLRAVEAADTSVVLAADSAAGLSAAVAWRVVALHGSADGPRSKLVPLRFGTP
jgi:hypothetical protein